MLVDIFNFSNKMLLVSFTLSIISLILFKLVSIRVRNKIIGSEKDEKVLQILVIILISASLLVCLWLLLSLICSIIYILEYFF